MSYTVDEARKKIKENIDVKKYLGKSKGKQYICPFCGSGTGKNGTGAFTVYPTNTFTCFACNKSGDVLDLIELHNNTDFMGAVKIGCQELGITLDKAPLKKHTQKPKPQEEQTESTAAAVDEVDYTEYYQECTNSLLNSDVAKSYLLNRGIDLGEAISCGLGFDEKINRIIIPFNGKSYTRRDITGKQKAKYLDKGSADIFALDNLYSDEPQPVFVCEGAFDSICISQLGYTSIALNSISNTDLFIKRVKEKKPVKGTSFLVVFDKDQDEKTAKKVSAAADNLISRLKDLGFKALAYDVLGNNGHDVNEAYLKDKEALRAKLDEATNARERDYLDVFNHNIFSKVYKPIKTGVKFFDDIEGGIINGQIYGIQGVPGSGKSALAQQLAEGIAKGGKKVLYFNFEMSKDQLIARQISRRLDEKNPDKRKELDLTALEILNAWNLSQESQFHVENEINAYRKDTFPYLKYITDSEKRYIENLEEYVTSIADENPQEAPILFIDYMHLLSSKKEDDVKEILKKAAQVLKDYATKYNTVVFAILAVNRESGRKGELDLFSSRDSSNIEYGFDNIVAIYHNTDNQEVKENNAKIIIYRRVKSRFKKAGTKHKLYFDDKHMRFYSISETASADNHRVIIEKHSKPTKVL